MTKNNPLFVDSTKFHGDRIATIVELTDVLLYDEESAIALIVDHQGEMSRVPLEPIADGNYEAKVWLSHQKQVTCQFLIEKNGREVFHSAAVKARAQYAIIQKWDPVEDEEPLPFELPPVTEAGADQPAVAASPALAVTPPTTGASRPTDSARAAEWAQRAEKLIEQWDL